MNNVERALRLLRAAERIVEIEVVARTQGKGVGAAEAKRELVDSVNDYALHHARRESQALGSRKAL